MIIRTLLHGIPACAGMTGIATALRQFELKIDAVKYTPAETGQTLMQRHSKKRLKISGYI